MSSDFLNNFLGSVDPAIAPLVGALDAAISESGAGLDRAVKWKQLVYAKDHDFHHWICAVAPSRKKVSLRFHFGGLMSDSDEVFRAATGKFLRSIDYVNQADVDGDVVARYVHEALSRFEYFKTIWKGRPAAE
jgi:hypothetical protein